MNRMYYFLLALLLASCTSCEDEGVPTPPKPSEIGFSDPENGGGCSNLMVYQYSDDHRYGLLLRANRQPLALSSDWQTFAVGKVDADVLSVKLYQFSEPVYAYFCDDVNEGFERPIGTWDAPSGTVRVRISPGASATDSLTSVDVVLENVVANNSRLPKITLSDVSIGWLPG